MLGENLPQTTHRQLPRGYNGNIETVQIMRRVAHARKGHPLVRQLALNILHTHNVASQNYVDEALAIARFVKEKVRYVRDIAGMEQLHDPLTMIEQIQRGVAQGDCDDMSLLIATLLLSVGHRPKFRIVKYSKSSPSFNHIYVVAYEKNWGKEPKRIVLDAILKRAPIGTEVKHVEGKEISL